MTTYDGKVLDQQGAVHNVKSSSYGAKGDAKVAANGAMSSGQYVLTVSGSAPFSSGDVGKRIRVAGAGASGVPLSTTIQSYTSASQVTLAASASVTVSGAWFVFGTDDQAALNAAIAAASSAGGGTVYVPPGTYLLGSSIALMQKVRLIGAGRASTVLRADADNSVLLYDASGHPSAINTGNIDVLDLSLVGGDDYQQVSLTHALVEVRNLTSVYIARCQFDQVRSTQPVVLWHWVEGSSIEETYFLNLRGYGAYLESQSNNNHFIGTSFGAIDNGEGWSVIGLALDDTTQNTVIVGCNFEGQGYGNIGLSCAGSVCSYVAGNFFEYWAGACIEASVGKATNLTIDNNHLLATAAAYCYVNVYSSSGPGPNDHVSITNNRFTFLGLPTGAALGINGGDTTNLVVLNNFATDGGVLLSIGGVNQPNGDVVSLPSALIMPARVACAVSRIVGFSGGTALIDPSVCGTAIVQPGDSSSFLIDVAGVPMYEGQALTIDVRAPADGSACGSVTFSSVFHLAGGSTGFTQPGSAKGRAICFYWDGGGWIETCRVSGDVA